MTMANIPPIVLKMREEIERKPAPQSAGINPPIVVPIKVAM